MARHYTREELLKLRESPLVSKPPTLPPAEEWMGPPIDANDTRNAPRNARGLNRTKTEDGLATDAVSSRRVPFDSRRKSTTAPEEIILGPPKAAFASASGRNAHRSAAATSHDDEKSEKIRSNFRDRFSRDGQKPDREDFQGRDGKPGQSQNRRFKDEGDSWSTKHTKFQGSDEREKPGRRNGDWEDLREKSDRGFDGTRSKSHKPHSESTNHDRRNGHWRSQDGPLWAQESPADNGSKGHNNESRDRTNTGLNTHNRGWNRGQPPDDDPLWMEAEPAEEKKQGHTIDDFEEFRRQMKARDGKKVDNDKPTTTEIQQTNPLSPRTGNANAKAKDKAFDFGDFNDAFLDSLNQPKKQQSTQTTIHEASRQEVAEAAAKMAKSSKFSNLFNANPATKNAILNQVQHGDASNEDRAGFQRILNLLGQQPQPSSGQKTPPRQTATDVAQNSPPMQSPRHQPHEEIRILPNAPPQPRTKESEFLLNLMQQPRQNHIDQSRQTAPPDRLGPSNGLSGPPFSNLVGSPHQEHPPSHLSNGPPHPSFFDEPSRHEAPVPRQDRLNPSGPPLQRPIPPGMSDFFAQRPGSNLPPGLERRPPGFDHLPPGYVGHQGPQSQQQRSMAPPPGFPPPQRPPTGVMPGPYGSRPNGPGSMPPPPPPPGFMNMGGPPPPPPTAPPLFGGFGPDGPGFGNGSFEFGPGFPGPGGQRR